MSASLVGSEMCIRDSSCACACVARTCIACSHSRARAHRCCRAELERVRARVPAHTLPTAQSCPRTPWRSG
eukprot:5250247-Alexandrium_andersonii.AAC.1